MEIEEIQKRVLEFENRWANTKNVKFDEELIMLHLVEEVGELAQQLFYKKAKQERFNEEKVKEELCDVILVALCLADKLKMNLSEELNKKLEQLNKRDLYTPKMEQENEITRDFVSTVYVVKDGKVLFNFHQDLKKFIPLGGHMEKDELPCEAAVREAKEESGFDVELIDIGEIKNKDLTQNLGIQLDIMAPNHQHINLSYIGKIIGGQQLEKSDRNTELRWFSPQEIINSFEIPEDSKEKALKAIKIMENIQVV